MPEPAPARPKHRHAHPAAHYEMRGWLPFPRNPQGVFQVLLLPGWMGLATFLHQAGTALASLIVVVLFAPQIWFRFGRIGFPQPGSRFAQARLAK